MDFEKLLNELTVEQKIGQCITSGFAGTVITDDLVQSIEQLHCGGLRLSPYSNNFEYKVREKIPFRFRDDPAYTQTRDKQIPKGISPYLSPVQYAALLDELQGIAEEANHGIPLLFSADQEGDMSADVVRGGVALFPSQMGLAATNDAELVYQVGMALGRQMYNSGINMIHSPVLDVNVLKDNVETDTRSFSDDPDTCIRFAQAFVAGIKQSPIIVTGKHFPGRGNSNVDAHDAVPYIHDSREVMWERELRVFKALIDSGLDAIMIAHTVYPCLDPEERLATISPAIITDLLREELGFTGVVTTDSITMDALANTFGVPEAAAMAIEAGADLILMKEESSMRGEIAFAIRQWVLSGRISMERLNASVRRILNMKSRNGLFSTPPARERAVNSFPDSGAVDVSRRAALQSMIVLRNDDHVLPVRKTTPIYLIDQVFLDRSPNDRWNHPRKLYELLLRHGFAVRYRTEFVYADYMMGGTEQKVRQNELLRYIEQDDYSLVIAMSIFYRNYLTDTSIIERLLESARSPVLVVTNTPYQTGCIKNARNQIINFSMTPGGYEALCAVLSGTAEPGGTLPIALAAH
jgi:beta-N-acetylhexosaminidase